MTLAAALVRRVIVLLVLALAVADVGAWYALKGDLVIGEVQILRQEATRAVHDLQVHGRFPIAPVAAVEGIAVYSAQGLLVRNRGAMPARLALAPGVSLAHGTMWYRFGFEGGRALLVRARDASVDKPVADLQRILAIVSFIVLLIGIWASRRVARGAAAPVTSLAQQVRRVTETAAYDSAILPDRAAPAEVQTLARDVNHMLRMLEDTCRSMETAHQRERAIRELAAHQLRTPMSTVLANLELLDGGSLAPRAARDALGLARTEAERLRERLEHLLADPRREGCDLGEAARSVAGPDRVRVTDGPAPIVSVSKAEAIEVLAILVDNASRHTPPGTPTEVRVGADALHAWVRVADHGAGMPAVVQRRAFQRGFSGGPSGGLGIGLGLARSLVAASGGTLRLDSIPGHGTTAEVRWPRAEGPS